MPDHTTFEARLGDALERYADQIPTDVDAVAFVRATRSAPARTGLTWRPVNRLRMALLLGLLLALAVASALLIGAPPSPEPPAVSNGWIAFAANRTDLPGDGAGEFRDIYLTREGTTARRIIGSARDGRSQGCPRFSPDGSRLAYGEGDESTREASRDGRGRWPITDRAVVVVELGADSVPSADMLRVSVSTDLGPLPCPEWSPTGSHLAFFTGTELWVVDVLTGARSTFPVSPTGTGVADFTILDLEWSPDGSAIAVAEQARIRSVPIDGQEPTELPAVGAWSLGWTADGKRLVYVDSDGAVHVADLDGNGERRLPADAWWTREGSVVVSPDGSRVAYRRGDGNGVGIIDADGSEVVSIDTASSPTTGLLWSPDGERLLHVECCPPGSLVSVAVTPGSSPVTYPSLDLSLEWVDIREHLLAGGRPVTLQSPTGPPWATRTTIHDSTGGAHPAVCPASPLELRTEGPEGRPCRDGGRN